MFIDGEPDHIFQRSEAKETKEQQQGATFAK